MFDGCVCLYAQVHDWNLTRSQIKGCRIKRTPFVTAHTCEWCLYFCLNQTRSLVCHSALESAFRKACMSAVDIHFDGLGILTYWLFCFAAQKNQEFMMKLKKQMVWKTKAKAPGKVQKSQDVQSKDLEKCLKKMCWN